jgi:hypothetical protein
MENQGIRIGSYPRIDFQHGALWIKGQLNHKMKKVNRCWSGSDDSQSDTETSWVEYWHENLVIKMIRHQNRWDYLSKLLPFVIMASCCSFLWRQWRSLFRIYHYVVMATDTVNLNRK